MKYQGEIYPLKLEIPKAFKKKMKDKDNQKFQSFLNKILFLTALKAYRYLIVKSIMYVNWRHLIVISPYISVILGSVDLYLSPELHAKNKSFAKDFKKTGEVNIDENTLQFSRTQLKDQSYSVSKICGF